MASQVSAVRRFVSSDLGVRWFPQVWTSRGHNTDHPCWVDLPEAFINKHCPNGFAQHSEAVRLARVYRGEEI